MRRGTRLGALVAVDLIQEAGATVAVVVQVMAGAEAGASLQKPNLHASHPLDLDQDLLLSPVRDQGLALHQDHDQEADLQCLRNA